MLVIADNLSVTYYFDKAENNQPVHTTMIIVRKYTIKYTYTGITCRFSNVSFMSHVRCVRTYRTTTCGTVTVV